MTPSFLFPNREPICGVLFSGLSYGQARKTTVRRHGRSNRVTVAQARANLATVQAQLASVSQKPTRSLRRRRAVKETLSAIRAVPSGCCLAPSLCCCSCVYQHCGAALVSSAQRHHEISVRSPWRSSRRAHCSTAYQTFLWPSSAVARSVLAAAASDIFAHWPRSFPVSKKSISTSHRLYSLPAVCHSSLRIGSGHSRHAPSLSASLAQSSARKSRDEIAAVAARRRPGCLAVTCWPRRPASPQLSATRRVNPRL